MGGLSWAEMVKKRREFEQKFLREATCAARDVRRWAGSPPAACLVASLGSSGVAGSPLHRPASRSGISGRAQLLPGVILDGSAASGVRPGA